MNRTTVSNLARPLVLGTGLAVALATAAAAQGLDPAEQTGQPYSMEGKSLLQDNTISSEPEGPFREQPLGEIGGIRIESDPNAPEEANSIMDDFGSNTGSNTGPPFPGD